MADNTHETKIVINGDASVAVNALKLVQTNIQRVTGVIKNVFGILGRINWVIGGVQTVIDWTRKLHDWIHRDEIAAKALNEELAKASYATAVAHAAANYEKLNKSLAETLRLEKERSAILEKRKSYSRDIEDAKLEARKQLEISALDPAATDYAARKSAIERKYSSIQSETTARRANEDIKSDASQLYRQADSKDAEARSYKKQLAAAQKIDQTAKEKAWAAAMKARSGKAEDVEARDKADEEWKKAYDFAKKIEEKMNAAKQEAASLRRSAGELAGGDMAARIQNETNQERIRNEARIAKAEEAKKKDAEKQKLEDARLEKQKKEEIAALDPADKNYASNKAEIERTYAIRQAELKVERAETPEDNQVAEIEKKTLGIQNEISRQEERKQQFDKQKTELEAFAGRAASFDGVSQNRLTAMGLGSGVSAKGTVESKVGRLVKLMEAQIQATKDIKVEPAVSAATYGE